MGTRMVTPAWHLAPRFYTRSTSSADGSRAFTISQGILWLHRPRGAPATSAEPEQDPRPSSTGAGTVTVRRRTMGCAAL